MDATKEDLYGIRDSSGCTTETVDQRDIQPQLHWIPTSPGQQTDISPCRVGDPLQDNHSDGSNGYSDQDDGPSCGPDNGTERSSLPAIRTSYMNIGKNEQNQTLNAERPSLPTVCTSYTHVDQAEQNQALYVDDQSIETGEASSKDIYDTDGNNANSVVQYQLKDRKEALATAYQCGVDVDDASVDRPDVQVDYTNSNAEDVDHDETQPETAIKQTKNAGSSERNKVGNKLVSDDREECIRPYAVAYRRDGQTNGEEEGVFDVQPYAVAYGEQ
ncbi:Hypp3862 [Branchiostoma lanceolatum]|uniref:Hypp3862 protein n=1 Tax=Branchiostoma lanceolatum TaxID=7740 RepID=A0A8K0A3T8_BRALA|nr:Hypp3862 [Branchiostoma lanceolatum]